MLIDQIVQTSLVIAGLTSLLLEIVKAVAIDPYFPDSPQRTGVLRLLNFLLNLGLLLAYLFFNHALDGADFITYIALALGQSVGSHVVQQTFSPTGGVAQVAARMVSPKPGSAAVSGSDVSGDVAPPSV